MAFASSLMAVPLSMPTDVFQHVQADCRGEIALLAGLAGLIDLCD